MFAAVINSVEPVPQPFVQLLERQQCLGIEFGEKLFAYRAKEAFDLAAAFGLIRRGVGARVESALNDKDSDGGGDARQLRRAVDLGVVHWRKSLKRIIKASGNTSRGDGLAQTIEKRIQPLVGIELGMRNQAAGART